jgi:hypothetical protein
MSEERVVLKARLGSVPLNVSLIEVGQFNLEEI